MLFDSVVPTFYRNVDKELCFPENTVRCTMKKVAL